MSAHLEQCLLPKPEASMSNEELLAQCWLLPGKRASNQRCFLVLAVSTEDPSIPGGCSKALPGALLSPTVREKISI